VASGVGRCGYSARHSNLDGSHLAVPIHRYQFTEQGLVGEGGLSILDRAIEVAAGDGCDAWEGDDSRGWCDLGRPLMNGGLAEGG